MTTNKDLKEQMLYISITEEMIQNAQRKCPIWAFVEKAFPDFSCKVLRSAISILPRRGNKGLYGKLPMEAVAFTHDFDFKLPVSPIDFYVDLRI